MNNRVLTSNYWKIGNATIHRSFWVSQTNTKHRTPVKKQSKSPLLKKKSADTFSELNAGCCSANSRWVGLVSSPLHLGLSVSVVVHRTHVLSRLLLLFTVMCPCAWTVRMVPANSYKGYDADALPGVVHAIRAGDKAEAQAQLSLAAERVQAAAGFIQLS